MLCLGIETASLKPGLALASEEGVLFQSPVPEPGLKAQAVFVHLNRIISSGQLDPARLDLIAVTAGPGSFTGLKVGVAAAKGLGFALDLPCAGLSSLEVLALNTVSTSPIPAGPAPTATGSVAALFDARRGLVYAGLFALGPEGSLKRLRPDAAMTPEELVKRLSAPESEGPVILVGRGLEAYGGFLLERLGQRAVLAPEEEWDLRAGTVARMGLEALRAGRVVPAKELAAAYLRPVDAVRPQRPLMSLD